MDIIVKGKYDCRFANWLFFIFSNADYDIKHDTIVANVRNDVKECLEQFGIKIKIDKNVLFDGDYKQEFNLIDIDKIRHEIIIPKYIKDEVFFNIPDIKERLIIHVRRGDYINNTNKGRYFTLNKKYINYVYHKYYDGMKVIVISDDKQWCKDNLSDLCEDIIISPFNNVLEDFCCLTLGKAIICSASSFSVFGAYLNNNDDCVIPYPYYKETKLQEYGEKIIPTWAKREELTDDMK